MGEEEDEEGKDEGRYWWVGIRWARGRDGGPSGVGVEEYFW